MTRWGPPSPLGRSVVRGWRLMGNWWEKRPGLTRARGRAGGNHWLDDAQGPGAGDGEFLALPCPACSPGLYVWRVGTSPGPLAGSEQCLRQEAGRHGAVPAHLGSAWWLAGTEQWTAFGLGSASPARRLRGRAVNANSLEAGSGGRQAWAHLLSSVPTTAQQTDGPGDPCRLGRRVYM